MIAHSLNHKSLQDLLEGNIFAIHVPHYTEASVAKHVADQILSEKYEYYDYAVGTVGRYGLSFSEVGEDQTQHAQYYDRAQSSLRKIRDTFSPYLSPIDNVRLQLDEIWPQGAHIANFYKKKSFVGLCRVIESAKEVYPHQDIVAWDALQCEEAQMIDKQIACNVYLQIPQEGGELELWDMQLDREEYLKLSEGSYGPKKDKLPPPICSIRPEVGDLIMFNCQKLHSISSGKGAHRLAMSCFIGTPTKGGPLLYWS